MPAPGRHTLASLRGPLNSLAPSYTRFRVAQRLLLTGHSHQAWPDIARAALVQAFDDAAALVDDKWALAFEQAERVRAGYRRLLDDRDGEIALSSSTHDGLVRFLSALDWPHRRALLTTDGEFHTVRRQLARLGEAGVEVIRLPFAPAGTLADRLADVVTKRGDRIAGAIVSTVSFERSEIVPGLGVLAAACDRAGVPLLLDAYHQLGVVPFSVAADRLENAFVVGGGYKYCQLGEGVAFLRFPSGCAMRPLVTGWFAEFGLVASARADGPTEYAEGPARFAGATYDPSAHYRAAAVFDFFVQQGLTASFLREVSQHQVGRLCAGFDALGIDPIIVARDHGLPLPSRAGFLALAAPDAAALVEGLRARGVSADARGGTLRLGPAPYLTDRQLDDAIAALADTVRALA